MNTKILEYILAIAEEKSISRAADRFYLTQPVLSRHLKKLEEEFGCPLFVRGPNGMQLTRAGILFINGAESILHAQSQLDAALEQMRSQNQSRIRLMVDTPYYNYFISHILPAFREHCPDTRVDVMSCNAAQARRALTSNEADLAVFNTLRLQVPNLEILTLLEDQLLPAFCPSFSGSPTMKGLRAAMKNGILPVLHPIGTTVRTLEEELLAGAGILPTTVLDASGFQSAIRLLLQTPNSCTFLTNALAPTYRPLHLVTGEPVCTFYSVAAYPKDMALRGPVRSLLQTITEEFSNFVSYVVSLPLFSLPGDSFLSGT